MNFLSFLLDVAKPMPDWISNSFPIIQTILIILVAIVAIIVLVAILFTTPNTSGGSNAVTGVNESYFMQNKGTSKEGKLKRIIITGAVLVLVFTILYFVLFGIYSGFDV